MQDLEVVDTSKLQDEFVKFFTDLGYLKYCGVWADSSEEDYPKQKARFLGDFFTPNQKVRITTTINGEFMVVPPNNDVRNFKYYMNRYNEEQIKELAKEILEYSETVVEYGKQ